MISRVPSCPDCGEPGILVKANYYRCPECKAVWKEANWEKRMAEEQAALTEADRTMGINALVVIQPMLCDNCGRIMEHAKQYCCNTNEIINDPGNSMAPIRSKRYCVRCSLRAGYMRIVRNTETGKMYPVLFRLEAEEFID